MADDLRARLAVFARLMEAEWHNGNMPESTYLRLNADLGGLVAAYAPPSDPAAPLRDALLAIEALPKWDKRSVPGGFHINRADVLSILRVALIPAPKEADRFSAATADLFDDKEREGDG